ncbi:MAG: hypothetical protein U9Q66_01220 [Patescibacteria group bacterium]|nr:hypothetical protein [Patescibacteria group bacterium]
MASPHVAGLVSSILAYTDDYNDVNSMKSFLKNNVDSLFTDSNKPIG